MAVNVALPGKRWRRRSGPEDFHNVLQEKVVTGCERFSCHENRVSLLMIQWHALIRHLMGTPAKWKGREYENDPSPKGAQETTEQDVLTAKIRKTPELLRERKFRIQTSGRKFGILGDLLRHRR